MCDEEVLERFLETGEVENTDKVRLIRERKVFPCYFGSALKNDRCGGILERCGKVRRKSGISKGIRCKSFKIARDEQGNRLTYMKITGGTLKVKTLLTEKEKVDQIRIYSGAKYELSNEVSAGSICAVTGLTTTYPGQGLGIEKESELPVWNRY